MERWTKAASLTLALLCGLVASGVALTVTMFAAFAVYLQNMDWLYVPLHGLVEPLSLLSVVGVGLGTGGLAYRLTRGASGYALIVLGAASLGWMLGLLTVAGVLPYYSVIAGLGLSLVFAIGAGRLMSRGQVTRGSSAAGDGRSVAS